MSKQVKWNCIDCNESFIGDDYTDLCSNCNSDNIIIEPTGPRGVPPIVKYALIGILSFIMLINFCGEDAAPIVPQKISVRLNIGDFDTSDKSISIDLVQLDKNGAVVGKRNDLLKFLNIQTQNIGKEHNFDLKLNKFGKNKSAKVYPCLSGVVKLSWTSPKNIKLLSPQKNKKIIVDFKSPNLKAECQLEALVINSIDDSPTDECKKIITCNYKEGIWISINGKNGEFKKDRFLKNFRDQDEYNVWAYHIYPGQSTIDTISYQNNGTKVLKGENCKSCKEKKVSIKSEFIKAMKGWLVNPKDIVLRDIILDLFSSNKNSITFDNKKWNFDQFYDHVTDKYHVEVYKLEANSIKFNSSTCKIRSFKVNIEH